MTDFKPYKKDRNVKTVGVFCYDMLGKGELLPFSLAKRLNKKRKQFKTTIK